MQDEETSILRILVAEELEIPVPSVLELDTDLRKLGLNARQQIKLARDIEQLFYIKFGDEEHLEWFSLSSILAALLRQQERMRRTGRGTWLNIDDLYEAILEVVAYRLGIPASELYLDTDLQREYAITIYDQADIAGTLEVALSTLMPNLDIGDKEHMRWRTPRDILMTFQLADILCVLAPF